MFISGAKCPTPPRDHDCEQKNEATRTGEKPPKGGDRLATRIVITNPRREKAPAGDKGIIQKVERSRIPKSLSDLSQNGYGKIMQVILSHHLFLPDSFASL